MGRYHRLIRGQWLMLGITCTLGMAFHVPESVLQAADLTIAGRIIDDQGRGISAADVGLMIARDVNNESVERFPFSATAKTDAEGHYQLSVPEPVNKEWGTVWAHATGFGPKRLTSTSSLANFAGKPSVNLQLEPAAATVIRVLDHQKKPVADAEVQLIHVRIKESIGWPIPVDWADRFRAKTDESGVAKIASFDPTALDHLRVDAPNSGRVEYDQNFFLNVKPKSLAPHYDVPTPLAGQVAGKLTFTGENPPDTRELTLITEVEPPFGPNVGVRGIAEVTAEPDGRFAVKHLAMGPLIARLTIPETEPWRARPPSDLKVVPAKTTQLNIPVDPAVRVEGLIRKQDTGQGYPKFSLSVIYGASAQTRQDMNDRVEVETDKDGRFSALVPPGPIELRLHSAPRDYHHIEWWDGRTRGGMWGTRRDVPAGAAKFELEPIDLAPTEKVEGQLVDQEGNPLARWTVFGFPEDKTNNGKPARRGFGPMNSFSGVNTDEQGRFSGYVPKPYPPVDWRVSHRVEGEGTRSRSDNFDATITSKDPLVIQVDTTKPVKE